MTCVCAMARSIVSFVLTKADSVVVSGRGVVFDGELPFLTESKTLFCVGNATRGRRSVKVQFVVLEGSDKYTTRVQPGVVVLEKGMACEFEVFATPQCSCTVDEAVVLSGVVVGRRKALHAKLAARARTELTTTHHYDDIVC